MLERVQHYLRRRQMKVAKPFGKKLDPSVLRLSLCDQNVDIVKEWLGVFGDVDAVEIIEGNLLDLDCDALLSPANSFGDMSGGLDKHIDDFYRGAAQETAMQAIRERFLGELPVGMALVLEMSAPRFPFLVVSPTMRVPSNVGETINAYLSLRAALVAVLQHNRAAEKRPIQTLAVPGLCTGVGAMGYAFSAQQMRAAYDSILGGGWEAVVHPAMAPFALGRSGKKWDWSKPA